MYWRVPAICPSRVNTSVTVASFSPKTLVCRARPKSSEFDPLSAHKNVGRLEIAVNDALSLRAIERIENLASILDHLSYRHRTGNRRPFDEFHHEIVRPNVVKCADVRMIQRSNHARFAFEAV